MCSGHPSESQFLSVHTFKLYPELLCVFVCVLDPPAWAEIRIGVSYSCVVLHLKLQPYYGEGVVCGQRSCQRQIETTVI